MPNWCHNMLTVRGPDDPRNRFWKAVEVKSDNEDHCTALSLNALLPTPQELVDTVAGNMGLASSQQKELEAKEKANFHNHGAKNWYDWNILNWGTKWDVNAILDFNNCAIDSLVYEFDSAWTPPIQWLMTISEQFPELEFILEYEEPGMCFRGRAVVKNKECDDTCKDYTPEFDDEKIEHAS